MDGYPRVFVVGLYQTLHEKCDSKQKLDSKNYWTWKGNRW